MIENFIIGITSGLIVTLFVLVFRSFWNSVVTPWFENRVYKDARIEGKWYGILADAPYFKQELITLTRSGHEISGKMICISGPDEGEEYILSGSFRNMILPLTYESSNAKKTDRGSLTLMCIRNGNRLTGKIASYSTGTDSVQAHSILWFRDKEDMLGFSKSDSENGSIEFTDIINKVQPKEKEIVEPFKGTANSKNHA